MGVYKDGVKKMRLLELLRPSVLSVSITLILLFIAALLQANLIEPDLPITVHDAKAKAWTGSELVVVEYKRTFEVSDDFIGTVIRSVKCNNGKSYDIADTTRKFTAGAHKTHRTVMLPYTISVGTECILSTSVAWQPTLSFVKFIQVVENIPFTVTDVRSNLDNWTPTDEEG